MSNDQFQLTLTDDMTARMATIRQLFDNEAQASPFEINSQSDFDYVADLLKKLKAGMKDIESDRSSLTAPLEAAKKAIIAEFKPFQDWAGGIEAMAKKAMNAWLDRQERLRRQAQAEADERARKERERLARKAQTAAKNGKDERAEELEMQAGAVQAPVIPETRKPEGVAGRVIWSAHITDKEAFVRAALDNPVYMAMIEIDEKKLNQMARMLGEAFSVPGATASTSRSLAIRA